MSLPSIRRLLPHGGLGTLAASLCAGTGLSRLIRIWRPSPVCILTFHGLSEAGHESDLLSSQDHPNATLFESVCEHLAQNYSVISLSDLMRARKHGRTMPKGAVVITFDDGYASNARLAWPILRRLKMPATIFLTTGFIDRSVLPWFIRLEQALTHTRAGSVQNLPLLTAEHRRAAYGALCSRFKSLSAREGLALLDAIEHAANVSTSPEASLPAPLQPLTWQEVREMWQSGLIEFGGHTHTHPVLGRCDEAMQRDEIFTCHRRIREELGHAPLAFAYTNGQRGDYNDTTRRLLLEAGFEAAFTMQPGFVSPLDAPFDLPRLGNPASLTEAEAMVSGVTDRLRTMSEWLRPRAETPLEAHA